MSEWNTVKVEDNTEMRLYVAHPKNLDNKKPGLLVIQEAFGVNQHMRDVVDHFADLGFVAASPELFHRSAGPGFEDNTYNFEKIAEHYKAMTDKNLEQDLKATFNFLKQDQRVDQNKIASVGYCLGGRASFLAAATLPIQAAACYYGGRIPTLLDKAKDVKAPLIFFWGGQDDHIGREQQDQVQAALKENKKFYIDIEFSAAQHGFSCDARPSYDKESSDAAEVMLLDFFERQLGL